MDDVISRRKEEVRKSLALIKDLIAKEEGFEAIRKYYPEIADNPQVLDLPLEGQTMIADVYSKCRRDGGSEDTCYRISCSSVKNAGFNPESKIEIYKRLEKGLTELVKIFKAERIETAPEKLPSPSIANIEAVMPKEENSVGNKVIEKYYDNESYAKEIRALLLDAPVINIPVDDLIATQDKILPEVIRKKQREGDSTPIYAIKFKGKYYIYDGHHRVAVAKLDGVQTISAKVVAVDSKANPVMKALVFKNLRDLRAFIEKAKAEIGDVHTRHDGTKWKKVGNGQWVEVDHEGKEKKPEADTGSDSAPKQHEKKPFVMTPELHAKVKDRADQIRKKLGDVPIKNGKTVEDVLVSHFHETDEDGSIGEPKHLVQNNHFMLTGGISGSGKSTNQTEINHYATIDSDRNKLHIDIPAGSMENNNKRHKISSTLAEHQRDLAMEMESGLCFDSVLRKPERADEMINDALSKNKKISIAFSYVRPETSICRTLTRTITHPERTPIPMDVILDGSNHSFGNFYRLYRKHKDNPNVSFDLQENDRDGKGLARSLMKDSKIQDNKVLQTCFEQQKLKQKENGNYESTANPRDEFLQRVSSDVGRKENISRIAGSLRGMASSKPEAYEQKVWDDIIENADQRATMIYDKWLKDFTKESDV